MSSSICQCEYLCMVACAMPLFAHHFPKTHYDGLDEDTWFFRFLMGIKEVKHFCVMQNTCHTNPALNTYFVETSKGKFVFVSSFIILFLKKNKKQPHNKTKQNQKPTHDSNQNYTFMNNIIKIWNVHSQYLSEAALVCSHAGLQHSGNKLCLMVSFQ